jgi:hypothetical protein
MTARSIFGSRRQPVVPVIGPPPLVGQFGGEAGFVFARKLSGEKALPPQEGWIFLPPRRLVHHVLVLGATGSGKTETLLRLAWTVAKRSDVPVFYLDGKGDRENAERFLGLMRDAGRDCRVFPCERFDGWRGGASDVQARLMEIIDYATEGPAAWYRDVAKTVLRLVCHHPEGPPRTAGMVLERMDLDVLRAAHPHDGVAATLSRAQVQQVRLRYDAFFGELHGALNGSWCWEDTTAGYLLLETLRLREETAGLARFLFEDFTQYFSTRKPRQQGCVLIVDEFSSLAAGGGMAARVEKARGYTTSLILAPQVVAGMGGDEEAQRIMGSVETVIAHRVNTPDEIANLAGTRMVPEYSTHIAPDGPTREGSFRLQHQFKVDPQKLRSLDPGVAYVISRGRACMAQILQAPTIRVPLPGVERSSAPVELSEELNNPFPKEKTGSTTTWGFDVSGLPF